MPLESGSAPASMEAGRYGLSWAALVNRWIVILLCVVVVGLIVGFDLLAPLRSIPVYVFIGLLGGLAWFPHFVNIHRTRTTQLIVYESPSTLTLWDIGKKAGLRIRGNPVHMTSVTGRDRIFVNSFNEETREASGTQAPGITALDYLSNVQAFNQLSEAYTSRLQEEQIVKELVTVRSQQIVKDNAEKWLRIGLAMQDPEPIIEALMNHGIDDETARKTDTDPMEAIDES